MTPPLRCEQCGGELPEEGAACPRCLLASGFELTGSQEAEVEGEKTEWIGNYKLLQKIGEGGFGVVYMAEQMHPVRRRVALKIIKLGMDTRAVVARFEAERQALALMDHPNIAKVLDAGATELGRPFFVMELVRGIKITAYCDQHKLPPRERLNIFMQVCDAVQHAHQKGIIHRDLKPSNILISLQDGVPVPKVIDFGIAKATSGQILTDKTLFTAFEQFLGTPAYMSPEQAEVSGLDVDSRSDIYSLGVLLYELLTGRTPFDQQRMIEAGLDEVRRIVREEEPQRPSTRLQALTPQEQTTLARRRGAEPPKLIHLIRGDLDWIVMKCLEKDRNRRYATSSELAGDVSRHLQNDPIHARPPSRIYRFERAWKRNQTLFASTALVVLVLIGALVTSLWQVRRARLAQRAEARHRQTAEAKSKEAVANLALVQIAEAESMLQQDLPHPALAKLASILRDAPENQVAANWITQLLLRRSWALPEEIRQTFTADKAATVHNTVGFLREKSGLGHQISRGGRYVLTPRMGDGIEPTGWDDALHEIEAIIIDTFTGKQVGEPFQMSWEFNFAFSPDERWFINGNMLRDLRSGGADMDLEAELLPNKSVIPDGTLNPYFSQDGDILLITGENGLLVLALSNAAKPRMVLCEHSSFSFAAISYDGKILLTADKEEAICRRLQDNSVTQRFQLPRHAGKPSAVVAASEKLTWFLLQNESNLYVWNPASNLESPLVGKFGKVWSAQLHPDLNLLTFVTTEKEVDIDWSTGVRQVLYSFNGKALGEWSSFNLMLRNELISPDGRWVISSSSQSHNRTVTKLTRAFEPSAMGIPLWNHHATYAPCFLPSGKIMTYGAEGQITEWSYPFGQASFTMPRRTSFSVEGGMLMFAESMGFLNYHYKAGFLSFKDEGVLLLYDMNNGAEYLRNPSRENFQIAFSEHGALFALYSHKGDIEVWSPSNTTPHVVLSIPQPPPTGSYERLPGARAPERPSTPTAQAPPPPAPPSVHPVQISFSADCSRLGAVLDDGGVAIFELLSATNRGATMLEIPGKPASEAVFDPSGRILLTLHKHDSMAAIWRVTERLPLATTGTTSSVTCATFSDEHTVLLGCRNGDIIRYDWDGNDLRAVDKKSLGQEISSFEVGRPGQRVLVISRGQSIGLWDLANGKWRRLDQPKVAMKGVNEFSPKPISAHLSPDGCWVTIGIRGGILQLFCAESGQRACEDFGSFGIWDGGISRDGTRLCAVANDLATAWFELPCLGVPAPNWWAEFAEQVAGCRYSEPQSISEIERMTRPKLQAWVQTKPESVYKSVAMWFLSDLESRSASPMSPATIRKKLEQRMSTGSAVAVSDALALPACEGEFLSRVAEYHASRAPEDAEVLSALATVWAATNSSVWERRARVLLSSPSASDVQRLAFVEAADRGLVDPNNAEIWRVRAWLNKKANRPREAESALNRWRTIAIPKREPSLPNHLLDLTPFYNAGLTQDWHNPADVGNNLKFFPSGNHVLGGTQFDVRGIVQLSSTNLISLVPFYPTNVIGIPVVRACQKLHFLLGLGWNEIEGSVVGRFIVRLADGSNSSIDITYGQDARNWQFWPEGVANESGDANPIWKGPQERWKEKWPSYGVRLYSMTWDNPNPDLEVTSVDLLSTMTGSAPFIIAITAEQ